MKICCAVPVLVSVVTAAVLLAFVSASGAVTYTGSGTYSYPPLDGSSGSIEAYDTTTVNVLSGLIDSDMEAYGNSTVNVSGGLIDGVLEAYEDSMVNFSGGTLVDELIAYDDSTVLVSGGTIEEYLEADDYSMVTVSGGSILDYLDAYSNSTVTVTGGSIGDELYADSDATITVSGGSIGSNLGADGDSTITIIGSFNLAYGDYGDGSALDGQTLTGFLADGTAINNLVDINESATVTLAVPEPATAALVLLGTGVLMCRPYSRAFGNEKAVRPAPRTIR